MPVRSFEISLHNNSGFALTRTFDHLCHGIWTPALRPPDTIQNDVRAMWKSESDGVATGTEGYVKYRIEGNGDTVYLYWNNPFAFGETWAKSQVSTEDIEPDCDFEKKVGVAVVPPQPSRFECPKTIEGQGEGAGILEFIWQVPLIPFFLFGNQRISEHAGVSLALVRKANNLKTFASRRRIDLSRGIRSLAPGVPVISLKAVMGF
jgi:hypothetical protein